MNLYKPEYMGKVIPADDPAKLTDFVTNKYDAFSKVYDACKEQSEDIKDIAVVENKDADVNSLSVSVQASEETMEKIKENSSEDVNVTGNVVTATA